MLGILVGTASLVGLVWVLAHGRGRHGCARWHGHGHGFGQCHGDPGSQHLHALCERLDTTPGQEKVIRSALGDFADSVRERGRLLRQSFEDVGRAVRGETLDEALLGEVFARHDRLMAELRRDAVAALNRVHETLDEGQRRKLGRLIESRFECGCLHRSFHAGCHPF
jgi:hypothetical protein